MIELAWNVSPVPGSYVGQFFLGEMNSGGRKISQSSGMVGITMSHHNVVNILRRKAELLDSTHRSVMFMELKSCMINQWLAEAFRWFENIQQPDARINKGEAGLVFQQKAVTQHGGIPGHQQRPAIDMVNPCHPNDLKKNYKANLPVPH